MEARAVHINIEDEIRKSYLEYALSVIIGRALPDARDGLEPGHRRILFALSGAAPAARRYPEVRLTRLAHELLQDLDKDTVDFVGNYDGSLKEPLVMPTRLPNLLVNGASGIAVGLATNIPPHSLDEVCNALLAVQENPEITVEEL